MRRGDVKLSNDLHHTSVILRPRYGVYLSPNQIRKARRALCPSKRCTCADDTLGIRGMRGELYLEPCHDGTAYIVFQRTD